jgi:hypothetical protein
MRTICTTFKAVPMSPPVRNEKGELMPPRPFGKVFVHIEQIASGEVVGVSFSTQGTTDDTAMGQFLRSISESLEGVG